MVNRSDLIKFIKFYNSQAEPQHRISGYSKLSKAELQDIVDKLEVKEEIKPIQPNLDEEIVTIKKRDKSKKKTSRDVIKLFELEDDREFTLDEKALILEELYYNLPFLLNEVDSDNVHYVSYNNGNFGFLILLLLDALAIDDGLKKGNGRAPYSLINFIDNIEIMKKDSKEYYAYLGYLIYKFELNPVLLSKFKIIVKPLYVRDIEPRKTYRFTILNKAYKKNKPVRIGELATFKPNGNLTESHRLREDKIHKNWLKGLGTKGPYRSNNDRGLFFYLDGSVQFYPYEEPEEDLGFQVCSKPLNILANNCLNESYLAVPVDPF